MNIKKRNIIAGALGLAVLGMGFTSTADPVVDTAKNGLKIKILKEKVTLSKTEEIIFKVWNNIDEFNKVGYYYLTDDICHIVVKDESNMEKLMSYNKDYGMISNIKISKGEYSMDELDDMKEDVENALQEMEIETYGVEIDFKKEKIKVLTPNIKAEDKEYLEDMFKDKINVISKYDNVNEVDAKDFSDMKPSRWSYEAVKYLQKKGIAAGNEDNTFRPTEAITREDAMTLAYKAIGVVSVYKPLPEMLKTYADQDEISQYAVKPIGYFESTSSISGYPDGTIKPKANIKRAEAAMFLANAFSFKMDKDADYETIRSEDVSPTDYYYSALQKLKKCGAFKDGENFRPQDDITREEFAYMLYKVCEK